MTSIVVIPLVIFVPILIFVILGLIGAWIYSSKKRNALSGFLLSSIFGIIFIVSVGIILFLSDLQTYNSSNNDSWFSHLLVIFGYVSVSGILIGLVLLWAFVPSRKNKAVVQVSRKTGNKIFISYRRDDSADATGRIYDRFIQQFGRNRVFKDVDSIPPGVDFAEYLTKYMDQCGTMIVVVGDKWLNITDSNNHRRLDNPGDYVRIEVEMALKRNLVVIPVLINDTSMPGVSELPEMLKSFAIRNAIRVRRDPDFHRDVDRLIKALRRN